MRTATGCLIGLVLALRVSADPLLAGRVLLPSGAPVAGAQVLLFDLTDLGAAPLAATTDGSGRFTLPLAGLAGVLPERFELGANYPNPFNPSTIIPYQLPSPTRVRLEVFNLLGQRVATLVDGEQPAGFHTAAWAATDASGQAVGAGVYLYRLSGDGAKITRRMLLIDGQAGIPSGRGGSTGSGGEAATEEAGETAPAYGLTVSGTGLVPYVDPAFRVAAGMGVDLVVEVPTGAPRAKVASAGLLGDGQTIYLSGCTAGEARVELRRESDDTVLRSYTFEVSGSAADLVVEAVSTSDSVLTADQRFTLNATVRNQGTGEAAATQLRWYRSSNRTISTRDLEVGTAAVRALAAAGTSAQSISLLAPPAEGTYYYGACVISVAGERAGNNCSVGFRVAVEAASPDLIVESVSISKGTLTPGETFTLRATVSNQGTGTAPAITLRWYRSSNEVISTRSTEVGKDAFSPLTAGFGYFGYTSISLTAPSSEGTYYYGACVAPVAGEANTRNNCSPGLPALVEEADHSPVTIPDANLRAAIEGALAKAGGSPITVAEMRTLTGRLDLQGLDISDLTGLESAVNARALWLNNNRRITDVAVLSALTNLVDLSLDGNRITDVSALSGLTRLQFLSLGSNNLTDVSALSSLDQLVWLTLDNNSLTDVSTLAGLANLVTLWLNGNRITDISALADLTNLETLWLDGNNISDISALSGLTKLRDLDLNGSRIADVSVLSGLTQLNELGLGVTDITDISPLMNMVHLTRLELRGTP